MPKTMQNRPTALSATPSRSNECVCSSSRGTLTATSTMPAIPTGTLTKKIHSQPAASMRKPPSNGPTSIATPATPPHRPIAEPRRFGGKVRMMTAIVCGAISAAPSPWTTRATISMVMLPASPHHSDEAVNTVSPSRKIGLGPNRSPSRPVTSSGTA